MDAQPEQRAPSLRLRAAMVSGVLNARNWQRSELLRAHGLWCWRMGLPMIWFEARSAGSRLSRVHMDLFTTRGRLSVSGHAALIALSSQYVAAKNATISAYAAEWDGVKPADVAEFARAVFRITRRAGNFEPAVQGAGPETSDSRVIPFPVARSA